MLNIAVFVSGGGTDLQSIIDAVKTGYIDNANVRAVIASRDNIYAIERAKRNNIDYYVFDSKNYQNLNQMYTILVEKLTDLHIDLIVLAGYLKILTPEIISKFKNRIINIHPSLIPLHCGKGFYGMKVHQSVIDSKDKESGATVHYVDEGTDTGKIIMQEKVKVYEDDTAETLQKRVLELEHKLLPKAIKKILNDLEDRK